MEVINLQDYPNICDKIQYELNDGKITYVDFFLNNSPVLKNFKKALTNTPIDDVSKVSLVNFDAKILPVIEIFIKDIEISKKNSIIKNQINLLKRK